MWIWPYCALACEPLFSCLKFVRSACSLVNMAPTITAVQPTPVAMCNRASLPKLPVARSGTQDIAGIAHEVDVELSWWVAMKALFEAPAGRRLWLLAKGLVFGSSHLNQHLL